ncbi:MAG: PorP/SprF family type IX secretion system membrane protein, partial [Bacteroidota bacterium]
MKKNILVFSLLLLFAFTGQAQDLHFTQYYATPMTLNPALTGALSGKYRFAFQYRDQWRSSLESPFSSFSAALDLRFPTQGGRSPLKDAVGAGIQFQTDRVSDLGFSITQMGLFGAFHKSLNERNNQYLSGGIRMAFFQRNVNYQSLNFGDEFDGTTGYTIGTSEALPANNYSYTDLSIGASYTYAPKNGLAVFAGLAYHHVTKPQLSFYYDEENPRASGDSPLYRKLTGHVNIQIPVTARLRITPRANVHLQGPHMEINAGTNFRLAVGEYGGSAFHIGGWVRPVTTVENSFY